MTHPRGNFARTSTRPYRMLRLPFVEIRALIAGGMTAPVVMLLTAPHAVKFEFVQPVKLNVYPSWMAFFPITSDVSEGRMYNSPFRINELFDDAVAISNSPLLQNKSPLARSGAEEQWKTLTQSHPYRPRASTR